MSNRRKTQSGVIAVLIGLLFTCMAIPAHAAPTPPFIPPTAHWLTTVNYYRQMAGLNPVSENASYSSGAYNHSCYMLYNGISHDEIPGRPGYTASGDSAGNNGNVAVSSVYGTSARSHIELWMTGPFHAIGVLRPNLQQVGFGKCDLQNTSPWKSGATLDVLRGLGPNTPISQPILFPGNGTTTNLDRFVTESPNPLTFCGWSSGGGLPVIAMMPTSVTGNVSATITGPSGPLQTCALYQGNTSGIAQSILGGNNAIVAMARNQLAPGNYTVNINSNAGAVSWQFTVDPNAATGVVAAAPEAAPTGASTGFQSVPPARVVDTRINKGATPLQGGFTKRIVIAGQGGVPSGASAVSANFAVVDPLGPGYLTVWNCASQMPVVSTLNYSVFEIVPNAASVPLDSGGALCVYSPQTTQLVIDVNGYYAASGDQRFTPVTPARIMDTRLGLGAPGRLAQAQTVSLDVTGSNGVPDGVSAVTLNVTSVAPAIPGYVTVYACDDGQPLAASLNPSPGKVRPNLVVTPVSDDGTVCFFTSVGLDLVVDVTGYLTDNNAATFTPTAPFRFVDTRDTGRPEMNHGTNGNRLGTGQMLVIPMAGVRGISADATAVSVNITVVNGIAPGYVSAWPCGPQPITSTGNYEAVAPVANGAHLALSGSGQLCVFVQAAAHVIIDVNGWWS